MVIPLFLFERKVLSGPNFYMSGYLEARREEYVEKMRAVAPDEAWTDWCAFFLEGIIAQAPENQARARAILDLHQRMQRQVTELTWSQYAGLAIDFLFGRPIFASTHFVEPSEMPRPTALRFLSVLRDADFLRVVQEEGRPASRDLCLPRPAEYRGGTSDAVSLTPSG